MKQQLNIPAIPTNKITDELLRTTDIMLRLIASENVVEAEQLAAKEINISPRHIGRWKTELRKLFGIARRAPMQQLIEHPQIRQAIQFILLPSERNDKGTIRSCKNFIVLHGDENGKGMKKFSVEQFIIAQFSFPGMTGNAVYNSLRNKFVSKLVVEETNGEIVTLKNLPSETTILRFIRFAKESAEYNMMFKKARSTKSQFDKLNFFVKKDPDEFRGRGFLELDHTPMDVEHIKSSDGSKGRFYITAIADSHSLGCGYNVTYNPNSESLKIATRNAILGTQIKIAVPTGEVDESGNPKFMYEAIPDAMDAMDILKTDNGLEMHSKDYQAFLGKVEFDDDARRAIQSFAEIDYSMLRHPTGKPHVERQYGVLNLLWAMLPGYTGSNYWKKPDSLKEETKNGQLLSDVELLQIIDAVWNAYNNKPVKRFGGMSRVQHYLAQRKMTKKIDERVLDMLMLKSNKTPTVRQGWIVINTVEYFSQELTRFDKQKVRCYYDPSNIGFVHCYIGKNFVATAVNRDQWGKTMKDNLELIKLRNKNNSELDNKIKTVRGGMTHLQAKANSFLGMLHNVRLTPVAELQKSLPIINSLTNLESQAKELEAAKKSAEQLVEIEKVIRNNKKITQLTPELLANIK